MEKPNITSRLLKESEKKFRNLVENVPVGISISTPEGKVIEVNPTILKLSSKKWG